MSHDPAAARPLAEDAVERRAIRSFVLRQGRVSDAQRRAHENLLPLFGVTYQPTSLNLDAAFGRANDKFLEIGFGMG